MILSILIPTMHQRGELLKQLMAVLTPQLTNNVEVLFDYGTETTGAKRNRLIKKASGKYIVFVDDDDIVATDYISSILEAAKLDTDCIVFSGWMETDGADRRKFFLSILHEYKAVDHGGEVIYYRYPNHITPIKRVIASQVKFPDQTMYEDYAWATEIHNLGLLKSEVKIHKQLYFYKFVTNK